MASSGQTSLRVRVGVVSSTSRAQRFEVTQADLNMYAVITGRTPTDEERDKALSPAAGPPDRGAVSKRRRWPTGSLGAHLRGLCPGATQRAPVDIGTWVRRLSCEARTLVQEARARLGSMRRAG